MYCEKDRTDYEPAFKMYSIYSLIKFVHILSRISPPEKFLYIASFFW